MAIHHELSGDIAVALLTGKERDPKELNDLKEVVFRIHTTLQKMTTDTRRRAIPVERNRREREGLVD